MTTLLRESAFWEEEKTRAKKKGGSSPDARIKRRKKRALLTPARPSNRAFERRNAILIQRIDLESTSRFGKPSTFAPRAKISPPPLFPPEMRAHSTQKREREKTSAKNTQKISNAKRPKTARTRRYSIYRTHLDVVERPFTEEFHFLRGEFSHICCCLLLCF